MTELLHDAPEQVDVHELWPTEARDFTPWLAENLDVLNDVLGEEITLLKREASVGPFAVDLAVSVAGVGPAVIENQLTESDHTHLGQLLTYAGGFSAKVAIWIAPSFHVEHLNAVDWINAQSDGERSVYALRVRVLRDLGELRPEFSLVAGPDGVAASEIEPGEWFMNRLELGFHQELIDRCVTAPVHRNASHLLYFETAVKDPGIGYNVRFWRNDQTSVHLWIGSSNREFNLAIFQSLRRDQAAINAEVGYELSWEENPPGGTSCAIRSYADVPPINSPEDIDVLRRGMVDRFLALRQALDKRLPAAIAAAEHIGRTEDD